MSKSKKVNFTRRANGEGSVYQIKDGRFGAAISLGKDEAGKRLRHVETGKTEQEAIDKMKRWLAQNGYMGEETIIINGQSTISEFVEEFKVKGLLGSGISDVTFENYSYALKHFQEYFKGKRIGMVDTDEINRFFVWMVNYTENGEFKYSQTSLDRTVYVTGRMFGRAVRKGYLSANPMKDNDFKKPVSKKKTLPIKSLTSEEISSLKTALMNNKIVYPVIALMSVLGHITHSIALILRRKKTKPFAIQRPFLPACVVQFDGEILTIPLAGQRIKPDIVILLTREWHTVLAEPNIVIVQYVWVCNSRKQFYEA